MNRFVQIAMLLVVAVFFSSCTWLQKLNRDGDEAVKLGLEETIIAEASSPALHAENAIVLTDNDDAFLHKLHMIENAKRSVDLAYFIFADDYSSSAMIKALIQAAQRGVRVRLLVDYHTNYKNLDMFSMMEHYGNKGSGSLQVRFYNRPSKHIVKDAVYLTMGCGEVMRGEGNQGCAQAKYNKIEEIFAGEFIHGEPIGDRNFSNLNIGGSGLFLSGLYSKNPNLMAMAVSQGQGIDPAKLEQGSAQAGNDAMDQLKKLGGIYWNSRFGSGVDRLANRLKLSLALMLYGEKIQPVYDTFTGYLPVEHPQGGASDRRDWDYLTEYLHHKFLLVDGNHLQLGGRNVEDSYHMAPNPLTHKYVFMDTDVNLQLPGVKSVLSQAFDQLWNFDDVVAGIADIRQHAPNDFLVATMAASDACKAKKSAKSAFKACFEAEMPKQISRPLSVRMKAWYKSVTNHALVYKTKYHERAKSKRSPSFAIDAQAQIYYVENLPYHDAQDAKGVVRNYGSVNGSEGEYGKHIHSVWLAALRNVCRIASEAHPQQVILHSAYFFPPSNLMDQFAQMVDGRQKCAHVQVKVLTNSIETTDLNVVNIAARHSVKAFAEYVRDHSDNRNSAQFSYYEYKAPEAGKGGANLSLHSKVEIFGPDAFIGSANADVRSYMMDSNNGLFVRNAPEFVSAYSKWVEAILADSGKSREITRYFMDTPREKMIEEDRATLHAILHKYRAERWIADDKMKELDSRFTGILEQVYTLSAGSMVGGKQGKKDQQTFNMIFKPI